MEFKSIVEYNSYLIASALHVPALEYLAVYNRIENGLDMSFATRLHELVRRVDCCVPHELLVEFGVVASTNTGPNVLAMLNQNNFEEGRDYVSLKTQGNRPTGGRPAKRYLLKPRAFKTILMRSRQRPQYSQYYAQLEEALVNYNDYQLALEREYIINFRKRYEEVVKSKDAKIDGLERSAKAKDDKIDRLEELVRSLGSRLDSGHKEIKADIKEVKEQNIVLQTQNIGLASALGEVRSQVAEAVEEVHSVADRLDEAALIAAPAPLNHLAAENLMLIKLNAGSAYDHQVIRRQTASLNSWVARTRKKYPRMQVLLDVPGVPNARSLWLRIRERLDGRLELQPRHPSRFRLVGGLTAAGLVSQAHEVIEAPARDFGATVASAKGRVQAIAEAVAQQMVAVLTDEDYAILGL